MPLSAAGQIREILRAGLLAGLIAGLAAGAFGLAVGEGALDNAIAVEHAEAHPAPEAHSHGSAGEEELVSRQAQHFGLVLATTLFGLCAGGLIALAFASLRGRTAHRSDWRLALGLVGSVYLAAVLLPFLKYPANPPGVGDPGSIETRTELYLVMVVGGLCALLAAWRIAQSVSPERRGRRLAAGGATFAGLALILVVALPSPEAVPGGYPGAILSDFRLASLGLQLTLWSVLAGSFAWLVSRPARGDRLAHGLRR